MLSRVETNTEEKVNQLEEKEESLSFKDSVEALHAGKDGGGAKTFPFGGDWIRLIVVNL